MNILAIRTWFSCLDSVWWNVHVKVCRAMNLCVPPSGKARAEKRTEVSKKRKAKELTKKKGNFKLASVKLKKKHKATPKSEFAAAAVAEPVGEGQEAAPAVVAPLPGAAAPAAPPPAPAAPAPPAALIPADEKLVAEAGNILEIPVPSFWRSLLPQACIAHPAKENPAECSNMFSAS